MCEAICTVSASGAIGRTYNLGRVHRDADLVLATHFVRTSLLSDLLEGEEALARGRLGNTALRQPDGTYRRIAGGQTFRIHPSSTLHPAQSSARGVSATSMHAIVFEELVLTTQTFARTVSRIDPGALQSLTTLST